MTATVAIDVPQNIISDPAKLATIAAAVMDKAVPPAASDQVDRVVSAVDDLVGRYPEAAKHTSGAIL